MVIWIINHYAYTPDDTAGTRHYSFAKELIKKGHEVVIISSSFYHKSYRERLDYKGKSWLLEDVHGVPFLWIKTPPYHGNSFSRIWNMFVFAFLIWHGKCVKELPPPQVIIGSSPDLFAAYAAYRLAQQIKVPFVFEVRDLWPIAQVEIAKIHPKHPMILLQGVIEKILYKKSHRIISLLPNAAKHMCTKGANPSKIDYIPNGIDINFVPSCQRPKEHKIFRVMYAGAHGPKNGIDVILDAADILIKDGWEHQVQIELMGDGMEKPRLMQRAQNEGLSIIKFIDAVPKAKVYEKLQEANAFIVNRHNHPINRFGVSLNKFFDYLVMARPTILGSAAFNNPFDDCGAGITVPPGNSRELADAVKKVANMSADERWEMGLRGRNYVTKVHDVVVLVEKLEKILFSLGQNPDGDLILLEEDR